MVAVAFGVWLKPVTERAATSCAMSEVEAKLAELEKRLALLETGGSET